MLLVTLNYVEVVNGQTCMTDHILHLRQHCSTKWRNSAYGGFPAMRRYKKRERKREAGGNSLPSGSASSWRRSVPDPPHPPKHSSRRSMDLSRQERKELSWWLNLFRTTLTTKKRWIVREDNETIQISMTYWAMCQRERTKHVVWTSMKKKSRIKK